MKDVPVRAYLGPGEEEGADIEFIQLKVVYI
jgi:hypothetical protein